MPEPSGAGSMRSPIVARNGFESAWRISTASPATVGRSTQIVVVSRKPTSRPKSLSERRLDDLLLHLAVERHGDLLTRVVLAHVDQRVLLGELRERDAEPCPVVGAAGNDHRLERGRREVMPRSRPFGSRRSCRRSGSRRDPRASRSLRRRPIRAARPNRRRRRQIAVTLSSAVQAERDAGLASAPSPRTCGRRRSSRRRRPARS